MVLQFFYVCIVGAVFFTILGHKFSLELSIAGIQVDFKIYFFGSRRKVHFILQSPDAQFYFGWQNLFPGV